MRDESWEWEGGWLKEEIVEDRLFLTVVIVTPSPWYSACRIFWWLRRLWLWGRVNIKSIAFLLRSLLASSEGEIFVQMQPPQQLPARSCFLFTCTLSWTRICHNETVAPHHTPFSRDVANYILFCKTFHTSDTYRSLSLPSRLTFVDMEKELLDCSASFPAAASAEAS